MDKKGAMAVFDYLILTVVALAVIFVVWMIFSGKVLSMLVPP